AAVEVHGDETAREPAGSQVGEHAPAHRGRIAGGPDHRDARRAEKRIEPRGKPAHGAQATTRRRPFREVAVTEAGALRLRRGLGVSVDFATRRTVSARFTAMARAGRLFFLFFCRCLRMPIGCLPYSSADRSASSASDVVKMPRMLSPSRTGRHPIFRSSSARAATVTGASGATVTGSSVMMLAISRPRLPPRG